MAFVIAIGWPVAVSDHVLVPETSHPRPIRLRGCLVMATVGEKLPAWTESAGGRGAWKRWLDAKVNSCVRRASRWAEKRGLLAEDLPTPAEWRSAILRAMEESQGSAHYSRLMLSLEPPRKATHWNWPSVDHIQSPGVAKIVLETRLVNDMKTIMSEQEFRDMISHLAFVLATQPTSLEDGWKCERSFAVEQSDDEPVLPE